MNSSDSTKKPLNLGELDPDFGSKGILRPDETYRGQATSIVWDKQRQHLTFACNMPLPRLYRASSNGELDATFGAGKGYVAVTFAPNRQERIERVLLQSDGKVVLIGSSHDQPLSFTAPAVARLEVDGRLDPGFGSAGIVIPDLIPGNAKPIGPIHGALQVDGKILITHSYSIFDGSHYLLVGVVARLNTNGSLDRTFGHDGVVVFRDEFDYELGAVLQQSDGKIVVGAIHFARPNRVTLTRLTHSGETDHAFGSGGHAPVDSQAVPGQITQDSSGRLICTGSQSIQGQPGAVVRRFNTDGSEDRTFKDTYQQGARWRDIGLLPNRTIIVVGESQSGTSLLASLRTDGTLEQLVTGWPGTYQSFALRDPAPLCVVVGDLSDTPAVFGYTIKGPSIIGHISVGNSPVNAICSPDGRRVYVTNQASNSVSVIDTTTDQVIHTITGLSVPWGLAINRNGTLLYIGNRGSQSVRVINTSDHSLARNITGFVSPYGLTLNANGTRLYVTCNSSHYVYVQDANTGARISSIIFASARDVAFNRSGTYLYAIDSSTTNGNVAVINPNNNTITARVGGHIHSAYSIACSPYADRAYISNTIDASVTILNTATNSFAKKLTGLTQPYTVAFNPAREEAYVTLGSPNTLCVIDTRSEEVTAELTGFNNPIGVAISPDGSKAYVVNNAGNSVSVVAL